MFLSALLLVSQELRAADTDPEFEALREKIFCRIFVSLQTIRAYPLTDKDRYLVVDAGRRGYVQCMFFDDDRNILCEVASGFYDKPGVQYAAPGKLPALAALGFSTDASAGNYRQEIPVSGTDSLAGVADTMVHVFYEVYGATVRNRFRFRAPLVKRLRQDSYAEGACQALTS